MMIQQDHHLSPESNDYKERPTEAYLYVRLYEKTRFWM